MASILASMSENNKNNEKEIKQTASKLSNHFQFGNQVSSGISDNRTSNNKLDQSLRISYAEMAETLEAYNPKFTKSVEEVNKIYENEYFTEWFKLMK